MKYHLTIEYCPKCNWMLRAAWMAQEFLSTFDGELEMVSLKPSENAGSFLIFIDKQIVFDRKSYGGFAEPKVLKQLIRDKIAPEKNLGHAEKKIDK
ncbi:SelT/SelW/SelH family protein [Lacihabitans sp. LS3-19]|uniref:SelT/SelW/SelH family protein n=1 Tax=Lacihabitans sp. LS3-19 TaxID=2487335 RepID=UPI0020CE6951|nr:SelT/SelW/SelH family protein [Lacihabitans sp. LS3-19]MCP9769839.1 SelT/SelW/SelH family protein [Lacihabitans sp. LS3-19]